MDVARLELDSLVVCGGLGVALDVARAGEERLFCGAVDVACALDRHRRLGWHVDFQGMDHPCRWACISGRFMNGTWTSTSLGAGVGQPRVGLVLEGGRPTGSAGVAWHMGGDSLGQACHPGAAGASRWVDMNGNDRMELNLRLV